MICLCACLLVGWFSQKKLKNFHLKNTKKIKQFETSSVFVSFTQATNVIHEKNNMK